MRYHKDRITTISLPYRLKADVVSHCLRKLQGEYLPGEGKSPKAFGLVGGTITGTNLSVELIIPLFKNARDCGEQKQAMDNAMNRHAFPSKTPLEQRGWVADSEELDSALNTLQGKGLRLIGNYHMHRVPWAHDPLRDTPTGLDTILGNDSRMFMFIISMVNPEAPIIRAFFEGIEDFELPIRII